MSDHRCDLPFTGSLHQCPTCGTWFQVVWFRGCACEVPASTPAGMHPCDDEADVRPWKGWQPISDPPRDTVPPTALPDRDGQVA